MNISDIRKWLWIGVVFVLLVSVLIYFDLPDGEVHVVFCDVGQGDGVLIAYGGFQALVDVGAYEDKMIRCIEQNIPFWDRKIELVFLSHEDKDHVGALSGIKKRFKVGEIVDKPSRGDVIRYKDIYFEILKGKEILAYGPDADSSDTNLGSVVMTLNHASKKVLFTGDIDLLTELAMVYSGLLTKVDVLKVSHHGSKNGSGEEFLAATMPKVAVVSVGAKNSYGHPSSDTLIRLDTVKTKVFRTDLLGTIEFVIGGKTTYVLVKR